MLRALKALDARLGHRGADLLMLGALDFVYGIGLLTPTPESASTSTYLYLASIAPHSVWAGMWFLVGAICLQQAFSVQDRVGFAAASALKIFWGLLHLVGWLAADVPRGYVSAAIWLAAAAWVLNSARRQEGYGAGGTA